MLERCGRVQRADRGDASASKRGHLCDEAKDCQHFESFAKFILAGPREGACFKLGQLGLGYYADALAPSSASRPAPTPLEAQARGRDRMQLRFDLRPRPS